MHGALATRGTLAEPVIESYSEMVAARMRGQIRSTVVSPATSKLLGAGFAVIEQSLVQAVVYDKYELEQQFLLENYKRAGFTGIGVAAGDESEEKKQAIEDDSDSDDDGGWNLTNPAWYDDKGNLLPLEKRPNPPTIPIEDSLVPIYDSSNKTSIIPKAHTGFSLVNTAQAVPVGAIATTMSSGGIVLQDLALAAALKASSSITGGAMNIARAFPQAALITGTAIGLHNSAQFEEQHPLFSSEFDNIMLDRYNLIPQSVKDSYWQKATNDPLLGNTGNSSGINMPIIQTSASSLLNDIRMDIDPNANRPSIESFPAVYKPKSILFTPDDRSALNDFGKLGGFTPDTWKILQESFPDQSQLIDDFDMSILERKIDLDYGKLSKEHFDNDIRYIHDKKHEGARITDLDPTVVERMSGLIITDNCGRVRGVHNTQDHHIIHQATRGAQELFDELGIDIHGPENRITLPSDIKLTEHEITNMTQHVGRHDQDIVWEIEDEVEEIRTALAEGELSKERAKERLLNYIQKHRHGLETGKKPLNSVGRE